MIQGREFTNPSDKKRVTLRDYVNCCTWHVLYVILCSYPKVYVGQTSQELRRRIQQHLSSITLANREQRLGKTFTPLTLHFLQVHGGRLDDVKVIGLTRLRSNIWGGDIAGRLLRTETRWIHPLNSVAPFGLNEEMLFMGFYKK